MMNKVEPPFGELSSRLSLTTAAFTVDQMQRDTAGMMEELLLKTLPIEPKTVDGSKK